MSVLPPIFCQTCRAFYTTAAHVCYITPTETTAGTEKATEEKPWSPTQKH